MESRKVCFIYDGNVVIEELDANKAKVARNIYGRNLITRYADDSSVILGYNGHGDVIYQASTTSGRVLVSYDYDEFGNVIDNTASNNARIPGPVENTEYADGSYPVDNPYRYAGYEYIEEIGIYDLNARYYNPEIARFLLQDPYYNLGNGAKEL